MSKNLPAISTSEAMKKITAACPVEAAIIQQALSRDIQQLGTAEVFLLRDSGGEVRAFKGKLTLSLANGGLVSIPGAATVVSAQGYEMWAEETGASVIFPKEVLVDGDWQANPAVVRDKENRRILYIYARAVAFRFSGKGIPQVSDWTTIFDTPSYRLIDLLGKAKRFPQAFRLYPSDMGKPEDPGTWAPYPFDESTTLYVNTSHEEALTWFAQILNREKKAIDFAQTFAKRNALKHLSGLQKAPAGESRKWRGKDGKEHETVTYTDSWTMPVLCWRPTGGNIVKWDATRYAQLQDRVGGLLSDQSAFESDEPGAQPLITQTEKKAGVERVSDEPGFQQIENSTDPEDQEGIEDAEIITPKEEQSLTEPEKKILAHLAEAREQLPQEFDTACAALSISSEINPIQAGAIMAKISELLG